MPRSGRGADVGAERLLELSRDPELRRQLGAAARHWAESEFSGARLAAKTEAVYRDVLGNSSPEAERLRSFPVD